MRAYSPIVLSHLQTGATRPRLLFWVIAKNRTTGLPETLGLWNGEDEASFTVDGVARTYLGAGGLIGIDAITSEMGLQVRMHTVRLSTADMRVINALRGYDARLAPAEIHRVFTDPDSHLPIDPPHRVFRGWVDKVVLPRPALGEESAIRITLASNARSLTMTLSTKYSDEAMKRRSGDRLFRYADISGAVPVYWGEKAQAPK